MDVHLPKEREVYLVGDNEDSLGQFQLTLRRKWQRNATPISRTQLWGDLTDDDVREGKFVFVLPFSPRQIICDETHPARSFHREIQRADIRMDSVFFVVYGERSPPLGRLFGDNIERLYCAGPHTKLEEYAERQRRLISLQTDRDSLNDLQRKEIMCFLAVGQPEGGEESLKKIMSTIALAAVCLGAAQLLLWLCSRPHTGREESALFCQRPKKYY